MQPRCGLCSKKCYYVHEGGRMPSVKIVQCTMVTCAKTHEYIFVEIINKGVSWVVNCSVESVWVEFSGLFFNLTCKIRVYMPFTRKVCDLFCLKVFF